MIGGPVNSDVFYAWIRQDLLPELPGRGVAVMDNAAFHNRLDIQETVTSAKHIPLNTCRFILLILIR